MNDSKNHNEVVIYYKDNEVVFVHPEPVHHHQRVLWSTYHYEHIKLYNESITDNLRIMGVLKTTLFKGKIIHQSFIPAKGISLRVVESDCICPNCGYMLNL